MPHFSLLSFPWYDTWFLSACAPVPAQTRYAVFVDDVSKEWRVSLAGDPAKLSGAATAFLDQDYLRSPGV